MILDCLQSREYCEVVTDDLLLFTPTKKSHITKLQDLLKTLPKNGLKISPQRSVSFSEKNYSIWEILYSLRIGECVLNHYEVG